ncbi:hypothetical protein EZV62_016196 [Acer yangbiense]|uniref:Retrotransposon gag domain-containing protein n=1 Tax=Acer yangbiense TaxID=1000413 RepID=A0A5C7HMS8_9ROSI|nr:hypothetical protein EZV62_016196 [Acer yangbiense]
MAFNRKVAARVEEQTRGHGKQRSHTKRSKSKGSFIDALEARITGLEDTLSRICNRKAMKVENFLFGLEQYFEANGVRDDATRITNAPTFLLESAQLWWRLKHGDSINPITTWDEFKRELKK